MRCEETFEKELCGDSKLNDAMFFLQSHIQLVGKLDEAGELCCRGRGGAVNMDPLRIQ